MILIATNHAKPDNTLESHMTFSVPETAWPVLLFTLRAMRLEHLAFVEDYLIEEAAWDGMTTDSGPGAEIEDLQDALDTALNALINVLKIDQAHNKEME